MIEKPSLKDDLARQRILTDLDHCMLVEAGAGSGKTASLVGRILALIYEGKCSISNVAAVTFTRKAAAEMKERLHIKLEEKLEAEEDEERRGRLRLALQNIDSCYIGTIHAFCARLLRERPVEAGLDPGFQEMDELEARLLQKRIWQEYLLDMQVKNPEKIEELVRAGMNINDLQDLYEKMNQYPEVEVICETVAPPPITEEVINELNLLLDVFADNCPRRVPPDGWDGLQELLHRVRRRWELLNRQQMDAEQFRLEFMKLMEMMKSSPKLAQYKWSDTGKRESASREERNIGAERAKRVEKQLKQFQERHVLRLLKTWEEHRYKTAVEFVRPAVELCQQYRFASGRLNYQDLLVKTVELLKIPEVRRYFQERYTRILVDEFQDTDPLQAEILFYLTGEDTEEMDWRKLKPRPGSLFIVGDPKQSIYRFRRADITVYNEVKELLVRAGGMTVSLTSNFRSVHEIGEWVNPVFEQIFPRESSQVQAPFSPLDTVRSTGLHDCSGVRKIILPRVERNNMTKIAEIDAERIARWIRFALDGGIKLARSQDEIARGLDEHPRPADFMIIFRYKTSIPLYTRALEKYGIPYQVSGGRGFSESPEVAELIKLWRALLDPGDPVILLAVLRGPLFGISDRQLLMHRMAGGVFDFRVDPPAADVNNDRRLIAAAFSDLRRYQEYFKTMPVSSALERIIQESGLLAWTAQGNLSQSRAGFLLQAWELIAAQERAGVTSPLALLECLELLYAEGVEEDMALQPGGGDAVRLMNLHKAKGLEAPVVFLAIPNIRESNRSGPDVHISRGEDGAKGYFLVKNNKNKELARPCNWEAFENLEKEHDEAEEERLLYVAATRARNLLIISYYPEGSNKGPWAKLVETGGELDELEFDSTEQAEDVSLDVNDAPPAEDCSLLGEDSWTKAQAGFMYGSFDPGLPTYARTSVTELVKSEECQGDGSAVTPGSGEFRGDDALVPTGAEGNSEVPDTTHEKGKEWGRIIHKAMAALAVNPQADLDILIENALREEERDLADKDRVKNLVSRIINSEIWQRLQNSSQYYVEVPMMIRVPGGNAAGEEAFNPETETIISAAIDLIFKEGDGWVIADYKTDAISWVPEKKAVRLKELIERYVPQVNMYRDFWEKLTGEKVKETGLYFTSVGEWVVIRQEE